MKSICSSDYFCMQYNGRSLLLAHEASQEYELLNTSVRFVHQETLALLQSFHFIITKQYDFTVMT